MFPKQFQEAAEVIEIIEENGFEAYFVGGCVRDLLLKRKVKDIDIATSASPETVQQMFPKVIPVGIEHGTVIVRHESESYEVTTFRQDGEYSDQRHPDHVTFIKNIDEDLKRRDFTINALAMDRSGKIIDLFSGEEDLQNKVIRSVGNAKERFLEDPLRIIRALRFASQLGFFIEEQTLIQMKELRDEIATVAVERITNELTRFFQGEFVENGMTYLISTKAYHFLPVFNKNETLIERTPSPLSPFYSFAEVIVMYHYLYTEISIIEWVKEWKCSNDIKAEAINIHNSICYYEKNGMDAWLIYQLHAAYFNSFIHLTELLFQDTSILLHDLQERKFALPIQKRTDLSINGHDLLGIFPQKQPGPWMKEMIEQIEYKVVMGELDNKKEVIKEWIKCHPPVIN